MVLFFCVTVSMTKEVPSRAACGGSGGLFEMAASRRKSGFLMPGLISD